MAVRNSLMTAVLRGVTPFRKAAVPATTVPSTAVGQASSWWGSIRESFSGAWQSNVVADPAHTLLAFSAVYACVTMIAGDISKLRLKLVEFDKGVWQEVDNPSYSPVLRKPNHYQTRIQLLNQWIQSKLIYGNAYVLKERDKRGVVVALYVLDPRIVKALITEDGEVYYQVGTDRLVGRKTAFTVPASEIIHDRTSCFFHPLIGISPIYACGISATQGNRIQQNSAKFFENMSRPSGQLTSPDVITDETAERLKRDFEEKFSGQNIGKLLVTGNGLKYEPMTIPAQQAQLIEQLKWTVEDVGRCFKVPLHKIGAATNVKFSNMAEMNQDYYSQTLQELIECVELLLDEGLGLTGGPQKLGVEVDLEALLRMDPVQRAERTDKLVKAGVMAPNEGRRIENLPPVEGGDEPYLQQQNYPLSQLANQPAPGSVPPPPVPAPAVTPPEPKEGEKPGDDAAKAAMDTITKMVGDFSARMTEVAEQEVERAARRDAAAAEQIEAIRRTALELQAERDSISAEKAELAEADAAREFMETILKGLEHV